LILRNEIVFKTERLFNFRNLKLMKIDVLKEIYRQKK